MAQNNPPDTARFDMKLPFWAMMVGLVTALAAYYGQREATAIAMTTINGQMIALTSELTGLKASVTRMDTSRYTAQDAARDYSWRDERSMELSKRISQLELDMRRKR